MLLLVALLSFALACPKETFWRNARCMGSIGRGVDGVKTVDDSCCECPHTRDLRVNADGRCFHKTKWLRRSVIVSKTCCDGVHLQQRGKRSPRRSENDPAKIAFNEVNGRGYFDAPPAPMDEEEPGYSSRSLLGAEELCATTGVNIRAGPAVTSRSIGQVRGGQKVTVLGRSSDQQWLRLANGHVAARYFRACGQARAPVATLAPRQVTLRTNAVTARPAPSAPSSSSGRNGLCPNFYKVWESYPSSHSVPSPELLSTIGFGSWITNTCAIRTSMGLSGIGLRPGEIGRTKWVAKGKRYLIRVAEMKPFLDAAFGAPYVTGGPGVPSGSSDAQGNPIYDHPASFKGKAGIIMYWNCGWSDATGHFDVWDGTTVRSHGYPDKCKNMALYDMCSPKANPDYSSFRAHLKRTNAA